MDLDCSEFAMNSNDSDFDEVYDEIEILEHCEKIEKSRMFDSESDLCVVAEKTEGQSLRPLIFTSSTSYPKQIGLENTVKRSIELEDRNKDVKRTRVKEPSTSDTAELAEFQADEEVEFGLARARVTSSPTIRKPVQRVAASAPPPLPPSAHPLMWPEQPKPRLRPGINADECQIFGDFVASELRTLRSDESRKRLKRIIQKAILQIGEEEDVNIISG